MSLILGDPKEELRRIPRNEAWERCFPNVSNKEYHEWPELGSTTAKERLKSAAHFRFQQHKENGAFDLGTAAHSLNLEGDSSVFVEMPEFRPIDTTIPGVKPGTTKKHTITIKAQVEEFQEKNKGKIILPPSSYSSLMGMHEAWLKNAEIQGIMKGAKVEQSYKYLDEQSGVPCKFRTDIDRSWEGVIFDYKTTISARNYEFEKAIVRYGYHFSGAHYLVGAQRVISSDVREFIFIPQEKEYPFALNIVPMSQRDIELSMKFRAKVLKAIAEDKERGTYPDYTAQRKETSLPGYAYDFTA